MSQGIVERRLWSNSAWGYVRSAFRLVLGVASFRLLCTDLTAEELGFYGLIWSFLGYGVVVDLGMGVTVQKRTGELLIRQDWKQLGRTLSSVLFCNCIWAVVIWVVGFGATDLLLRSVEVSARNSADFHIALRVFFLGMGALIPLEMFREVLHGQQRIAVADGISTVSGVVSFILVVGALRMHWGLPVLLSLQMTCLIVTDVVLALSALGAMPEVRLRIRDVSWSVLRGMARFSAHAYIVVIAGIIVLQMDRFLVGTILSVSAVATYHIGAKVPELCAAFTQQLPGALAPAAAALHGKGNHSNWQLFFRQGIRLNALITTPLFILCMVFLENILGLLVPSRANDTTIILLGRTLLIWTYSTILTHGITKAVFLMCGREERLVRLLIMEALANLATTYLLLHWLESPIGAAVGSLVPALIMGWGFLWPWAAREIGTTPVRLVRDTLIPAFVASGPLLAFGLLCRVVPFFDARWSIPAFFVEGIVAVAIAALGTWRLGLETEERTTILARFRETLTRVRSLQPWFS